MASARYVFALVLLSILMVLTFYVGVSTSILENVSNGLSPAEQLALAVLALCAAIIFSWYMGRQLERLAEFLQEKFDGDGPRPSGSWPQDCERPAFLPDLEDSDRRPAA